MLKFGTIQQIDANKGLVRVSFEADGIVSGWLPFIQRGTKSDKFFSMPTSGEHVACMMDGNAEHGVCLGAIYSSAEAPGAVKGQGVVGVEFGDGTKVLYDQNSKELTIEGADILVHITCENAHIQASGDITLTGNVTIDGNLSANGDINTTGSIEATGDVTAGKVGALGVGLLTHIHPTPSGPSSPPTNPS